MSICVYIYFSFVGGAYDILSDFREVRLPIKKKVGNLVMTLNSIWWWGFCSGARGNVEYSFMVITPRSTMIRSSSTC